MKYRLYSELRTIYETDAADPHTFRITAKLKDIVDGAVLRQAVDLTMKRYPYFRVRMCEEGGTLYFEDNPEPLPVIQTNRKIVLGSSQVSGHLLAFCYWKNRLYIDGFHGLTDGGGLAPMIKTLMYYYCSMLYDTALSAEDIRLSDDSVSQLEWDDPARVPVILDPGRTIRVTKWNRPAFQIADGGVAHLTTDSLVYNIHVPEKEFMRFNVSNDGSPATIVALLLARTIRELHPDAPLPPVIAMCVNQRRALKAPLAHQSLVGDIRLPYTDQLEKLPFSTQATCFRGMVMLQSDDDMVLEDIREYQALAAHLETLDSHAMRQEYCRNRMEALSKCITATVSYVGKANMGDAERYFQEYEALPSTALPSTHVPLTVEISAVNGFFFMNFIQYFTEYDYFSAFIRQFRKNGINYDVLNVTEARYPYLELPPVLKEN